VIIIKLFEKISFFVVLVLLFSIFSGCTESNKDTGDNFVFTDVNGETKHLIDYRGKVVILDMWATWCGPCQLMMLELNKAYENYSRNDLEIISLDVYLNENVQIIQSYRTWFFQNYGVELNWTFGKDDGNIWKKYRLSDPGGIPTLYIFDKNGKVYYSNEGYESYSLFSSKIDELLNKK